MSTPRAAKTVSVSHCRCCRTVYLRLHGSDDAIFAYAPLSAENAVAIVGEMTSVVEAIVADRKAEGGLADMTCEGCA